MKNIILLVAFLAGALGGHHGARPFHPLATYLHPELYSQYHRGLRPNYGTENETVVKTNMYIRRISELDQERDILGMDITLRQMWNDPRLKHDSESQVTLTNKDAWDRIWMPDTFFRNSITERKHDLPTPNQYARVFPNGDVLISERYKMDYSLNMLLLIVFLFLKIVCSVRLSRNQVAGCKQ